MADKSENPVKKSSTWKRKLGIGAGVMVFLGVVGYFTVTSAAFLKGVVLPRAGKMLDASITVEDASISPFSGVSLRGLKVQTTGSEPFVQAESAQVRYSLWDIITGKINVSELTLQTPQVRLIKNADGSSNLDPILKALKKNQSPSSPKPVTPSKAPQLDLRNLGLKNASVRITENFKDGSHQDIELLSVNITVDQVRNGISGKFNLTTDVNFLRTFKNNPTNDVLQTRATAAFEFLTTADLEPQSIKGNARLDITKALGGFDDLAGLNGLLDCELTPTDFKKFDVRFAKGASSLGAVSVSGPFDPVKVEGKLKLVVSAIDRQVLNLVGLPMGIDFGTTKISATSQIDLTKGGKMVNTVGQLDVSTFSVTRAGQTTPTLDLRATYDVVVDVPAQNALLQKFTIDGTQNKKSLLSVSVDKPMTITWNTNSVTGSISDSELALKVTDLNLADWRAFAGNVAPAGKVDVTLKILAQQAGKKIDLNLDTKISDLTVKFGSNHLDKAGVDVVMKGKVDDFKQIDLSQFQVQVTQQKQAAVKVGGTLQFNTLSQDADVQTTLEVLLPKTLALLDRPDVSASSGKLEFTGRITQKNERTAGKTNTTQTVKGSLKLADFTGKYTNYLFNAFGTALDCDLEVKDQVLQIRKLAGQLTQNKQNGGSLDVSGSYNIAKQAGQVALKLTDLNQNVIGTFATPALAPNKLVSISINSDITANYDAAGASAVKGNLTVGNVLVGDPKNQMPKVPVSLVVQLDASLAKDRLDLRQFNGKLAQGSNPAGAFDVSGTYDLKKQAGQGAIKLTDINQNGLAPFLAPALGDKTLASISINADTKAKYDAKGDSNIKGSLQVANLLINDPKKQLPTTPTSLSVELDGSLANDKLDLRQFAGKLVQGKDAAGSFEITGNYDLKKEAGAGKLKLTDLNQNALRPVLASSLGDKTLTSVSINADGSAKYDVKGESSVNMGFELNNLVITDPKNPALKNPLSAKFQLDGAMLKNVLTLRQFQIALSPTARAKNQLSAQGTVDLTNTNAAMANLKITAESLDITPFYDLMDDQKKQKKAEAAKVANTTPQPEVEPAAMYLPLRQSTVDVNVGSFYLREVAVKDFALKLLVETNRVQVKPFRATLNGAPINATVDANVGVPGYQYDLVLTANRIPAEPIVNSFVPEHKGRVQGSTIVDVKVKGAGVTGESLRKNLNGNVGLSFTNASIQLEKGLLKTILAGVSIGLGAPELLKSPINYLTTDIQLGNGNIDLRNFTAHSDAFIAQSHGVIPIANVLTNSPLNHDVEISLPRSIMSRYPGVNMPPGAAYGKLPTFAHVKGTIGNPEVKTDKLVIAGMTAAGVLGNVGGKAGNIGKALGGLLGGQQPAAQTPPPGTVQSNAPPANTKPKLSDFLKLIPEKKK